MAKILLGVTGSVATIKLPEFVTELAVAGHELRIVATDASFYFFDPSNLPMVGRGPVPLFRDSDEWPNNRYHRGDAVLHIQLREWADLMVIAPLDANTLAKFAHGFCDNLLTCILRAWDFASKSIILAPAMNTLMWENPLTRKHFQLLLDVFSTNALPEPNWSLHQVADLFSLYAPQITIALPQSKKLACGDIGMGAMADLSVLLDLVLERASRIPDNE